jgi:hypothetical protein
MEMGPDIEVHFIKARQGEQIVALAIHSETGVKEYSGPKDSYEEAEREARELLDASLASRIDEVERGERTESSYYRKGF